MASWLSGLRDKSHPSLMDASIASLRYVVLDTELTSLEHRSNRLLSVGAIAMQGASIELGSQFYRVVNPRCEIPAEGIVIHKLRTQEIETGEDPAKALDDLRGFIEGAVLVGHFAEIDLKILRKEMLQTGHQLDNPALCTARAHHWILRQGPYSEDLPVQLGNLDLATLAKFYGLEPHDAHHALADAFQTARIWQKMLYMLQQRGVENLKKLMKVAGL
jgi:DNA polymerase III subunit epsilon